MFHAVIAAHKLVLGMMFSMRDMSDKWRIEPPMLCGGGKPETGILSISSKPVNTTGFTTRDRCPP
jgi:hypothetical protein